MRGASRKHSLVTVGEEALKGSRPMGYGPERLARPLRPDQHAAPPKFIEPLLDRRGPGLDRADLGDRPPRYVTVTVVPVRTWRSTSEKRAFASDVE